MKNIDAWKIKMCNKIMKMEIEELYELVADYGNMCIKCREVYGECEESHDEDVCKERFKNWCERNV